MADLKKMHEDVKRAHDELALKVHLASRDLQDEWSRLEQRWKEFEAKAQLQRTAKDLGAAVEILGSELKSAYTRLHKALH
jgi:predicted nuclease with TOPRIM domain